MKLITFDMGIENFIRNAFYEPNDAIAYNVARALAELHPGKAIVESTSGLFDIEDFVGAGKCSIIEQKSIFHHVRTDWIRPGKLEQEIENSWLNVLWQGHLLDVVIITWTQYCHSRPRYWIIADEPNVAESFLDAVCEWGCEVRGEILIYKDGYFEKDEELFNSIKSSTLDNLVLRGSLREEIQNDFKQFFNSRDVYERYGIPWRRGAVFIGPPGNGKTHTLKALINELGKPCLYVRSFKCAGATEQENMAEVFQRARMAPSVVVLEDLDSMIDNENRSFFLNELDGFQPNTGVVVLATTNHPDKLDPSILDRPSRFDRKYHFDLPQPTERLTYINKWNRELQPELRISDDGAATLVSETEGFSFAYLKELFVASTVQWLSEGRRRSSYDVLLTQAGTLRGQMNSKPENG
ncbi:MAG TPA: ATP-binding protein [Pyrinomonadaceae bacterium]|nr:ATP-binding protein [Pyrinomonadaceae bacterium]